MLRSHQGFELRGETTPLRTLVRDMWRSRSLLRILARRDFYVRYRRPSFGMLWAIGLPLINAAVLAVVFTRIVRVETEVAYSAFVVAGVLPWTFFSACLTSATTSISDGGALATKIYFPRALLPLIVVGGNLYGLIPGLAVVVGIAALFGVNPWPQVLFLPVAILVGVLLASAVGLVTSALNVYFRDIGYILQAGTTALFYGSAVFYPVWRVPEGPLRFLVELNPATGMVQLFRYAVIGPADVILTPLWATAGWSIVLLVVAVLLHRRFDRLFADLMTR